MRKNHIHTSCLITAATIAALFHTDVAVAQDWRGGYDPQAYQPVYSREPQVLTRGPVHEAFAEAVIFDSQPDMVASRPPPPRIEERAPYQRPDGPDVVWIPGYWAWDEEFDDYLWVSGVWRCVPPGRQWVSGYWTQTGRGYLWVPGYWASIAANVMEYLPPPPESLESGPNGPQPQPNQFWVPGSWVWHGGRYAWRPGYWAAVRENWDWVPARYVWTPRGFVFVEGHWDYVVTRRGTLFAPVYFDRPATACSGVTFAPTVALDLAAFVDHLFVRPRYSHYYFGDYYSYRYEERGYYSTYTTRFSRQFYCPIIVHKRWENRRNPTWERDCEDRIRHYREYESARPRRTLIDQRAVIRTAPHSPNRGTVVTKLLSQLANRKHDPVRYRNVERDEHDGLERLGRDLWNFISERRKVEDVRPDHTDGRHGHDGHDARPTRADLPRSPIAGRPADQFENDRKPPKPHRSPEPDPRVQPKRKEIHKQERKD